MQERGCAIHVDDHNLGPPVAVEISHGESSGWPRYVESWSRGRTEFNKTAVASIVEQERRFEVLVADRLVFYLRINVAIGDHQVVPAIIVHVHKRDAPTQKLA